MPHTQQDFLERRSLALKLTSWSLQNLGHGFQGSFSQSQLAGLTGIFQTGSLAIFREPELVPFPMQQWAANHLFKTSARTTMAWAPSWAVSWLWASWEGKHYSEHPSTTWKRQPQQKQGARVAEDQEGISLNSVPQWSQFPNRHIRNLLPCTQPASVSSPSTGRSHYYHVIAQAAGAHRCEGIFSKHWVIELKPTLVCSSSF